MANHEPCGYTEGERSEEIEAVKTCGTAVGGAMLNGIDKSLYDGKERSGRKNEFGIGYVEREEECTRDKQDSEKCDEQILFHKLFINKIDIFIGGMHIIVFACETLQIVGGVFQIIEVASIALRFAPVGIELFLHSRDAAGAGDAVDQALLSTEGEHEGKQQTNKHVLIEQVFAQIEPDKIPVRFLHRFSVLLQRYEE